MRKISYLNSALLFAIYTTGIQANEAEKNDNAQYSTIENITVLGSAATQDAELGGTNIKTLPINTHVVNRAELERLRFVDPNEFLDRIPGETQVRNLRIPDGGKGYTIPMLDGLPIENPYEGATQRLDRTNTFDIERIEIIKGPASALYPNNAFGGVVNVVSRNAPRSPETRVSIEAGDFNRLRAGISTGGKANKLRYFFDANTQNVDGLRKETKNDKNQVSGKLTHQINDATKLTSRIEYLEQNEVLRGDLNAQQLKEAPTQAGSLSSSTDLQQSALTVAFQHILTSGQLDMNIVRREKDTIGASRFSGPQDENDLGYNAKIMYRHDLTSANVIVGYELYDGQQKTKQYGRQDFTLTGPFTDLQNDLTIDAYFAQYQITATDKATVTLGARYEDISLASSQFEAQQGQFSDLAPKFGITYQLNTDNMLWFGTSKGFYAPDANDLFAIEWDADGNIIAQGDPNLKPEEATNIEIGLRGQWQDWHYDTSIYHNDVSNYLVTQEFEIEGLEVEQTTNAGKVNLKGIESVIEYSPKNASWRAGLTHTFTRNKYDRFIQTSNGITTDLSGKLLRRSPDHHLNVRLAWIPVEGLTAEIEGDFYSHYFGDNENSADAKFTRGKRINLRLDYKLNHWQFWLHGLNLTDTLEDRATYSTSKGLTFRTIDGRTLYAGVAYTF